MQVTSSQFHRGQIIYVPSPRDRLFVTVVLHLPGRWLPACEKSKGSLRQDAASGKTSHAGHENGRIVYVPRRHRHHRRIARERRKLTLLLIKIAGRQIDPQQQRLWIETVCHWAAVGSRHAYMQKSADDESPQIMQLNRI